MTPTTTPRSIEIVGSGWVDRADSAFARTIALPSGELLCSYSNAGGAYATGGTGVSRSTDGGRTWTREADVLPVGTNPPSSNFLKLSRSADGRTLYAYGTRSADVDGMVFGTRPATAILCTSQDEGRTWSTPAEVPMPTDMLEVSDAALVLPSGRLIAPAATVDPGRPGERVVAAISDDGGRTWPQTVDVLRDPERRLGYLEQKLVDLGDGRLLATAWTVTMDDLADQPNSFAISTDDGLTWTPPRFIGTLGQTISAQPLGGGRVLLLYNRRYGRQGVVMAIADITDEAWPIHWEGLVHDAAAERERAPGADAIEEMKTFAFGFPTAVRLSDGDLLATWWASPDGGSTGIAWARLHPVA